MDQPGGALFIPESSAGRFDNPDLYRLLYAAAEPECAIAERFGNFSRWRPETFRQSVAGRIVQFALATYDAPIVDACDLASVAELRRLEVDNIREIVTRDRGVTQHFAARVHNMGRDTGLKWWSFYNPEWTNVALWNRRELTLVRDPEPLSTKHPAVIKAAEDLPRVLVT